MQWFSTVFLYALPFPIVVRLWDLFLVDHFPAMYAIALALLKMHEKRVLPWCLCVRFDSYHCLFPIQLLASDWEGVMQTLFAFDKLDVEPNDIIALAGHFKITDEQLQSVSLGYHKHREAKEAAAAEHDARREADRLARDALAATPMLDGDDGALSAVEGPKKSRSRKVKKDKNKDKDKDNNEDSKSEH